MRIQFEEEYTLSLSLHTFSGHLTWLSESYFLETTPAADLTIFVLQLGYDYCQLVTDCNHPYRHMIIASVYTRFSSSYFLKLTPHSISYKLMGGVSQFNLTQAECSSFATTYNDQ